MHARNLSLVSGHRDRDIHHASDGAWPGVRIDSDLSSIGMAGLICLSRPARADTTVISGAARARRVTIMESSICPPAPQAGGGVTVDDAQGFTPGEYINAALTIRRFKSRRPYSA